MGLLDGLDRTRGGVFHRELSHPAEAWLDGAGLRTVAERAEVDRKNVRGAAGASERATRESERMPRPTPPAGARGS